MATRRRRRFTAEFKKRVALESLRGDRTMQEIAARHEVHPNQVSQWKRQAAEGLEEIFANGRVSRQSEHDSTIRDLHAKIGELTVERDFFCAGFSAEPRGATGDDGPQRRVEYPSAVRVAGDQSFVGVLQAAGGRAGRIWP